MTTYTAGPLRPMRFDGERRFAVALELGRDSFSDLGSLIEATEASTSRGVDRGAALAYGFVDARRADAVFGRLGWTPLGAAPLLARPLRLSAAAEQLSLPWTARSLLPKTPLLSPFGGGRRSEVREIATRDPRVTRLWDRFSIDVGVAIERTASWVGARIFERPDAGYRTLIFEDGDRYVIRALCIFRTKSEGHRVTGHVVELLHDRSVTGMRAASHLLALALREMSDRGAEAALAWALVHSGSFPIYARHAFLPMSHRSGLQLGVRALDPTIAPIVEQRSHWYLSGLDLDGF